MITINKTLDDIRDRVHPKCVVCSSVHPRGLNLKFDIVKDKGVVATFQCNEELEGYPGVLHGGIISTVLDGAMGHCMFARGQAAVTVEMTTRFRHPVVTGRPAMVSARITRISHPLYLLEAEIVQNGEVKATAKGKFYDQPELVEVLETFS